MQTQKEGEGGNQNGQSSDQILTVPGKGQSKKMEQNTSLPIGADFNQHSGDFVVVTSNDIRVYCGASGQLLKIFSDIQDDRSKAEIRSFSLDSRHRKILLGDSDGTMRALNLSNGVKIMTYSNRNDEDFQEKRAESLSKDKNREINSIQVI